MKYKKIIIISFATILFLILTGISTYAANDSTGMFIVDDGNTLDDRYTFGEYIRIVEPDHLKFGPNPDYPTGEQIVWFDNYRLVDNGSYLTSYSIIESGKTYTIVGICNHQYVTEVIYGNWPCQDKLYKYTCSLCSETYLENIPASIDHDYQIEIESYIPATCGTPGYALYECVYCKLSYSEETLDLNPNNHTITKATCSDPRTCTECGLTFGDPLDHKLDVWGQCKNCDYNTFKNTADDIGSWFSDGWSKLTGPVSNTFSGLFDSANDKIEEGKRTLNDLLSLFALVAFILVAIIVVKILNKKKTPERNSIYEWKDKNKQE